MLFLGEGAANTSGNNRFDNLSIHGTDILSSITESGIEQLSIYPNPASTEVYIDDLTEGSIVRIYNMNGKLMLSETANDQKARINISSLIKGVYVLNVQESKTGKLRIAKLIVQ